MRLEARKGTYEVYQAGKPVIQRAKWAQGDKDAEDMMVRKTSRDREKEETRSAGDGWRGKMIIESHKGQEGQGLGDQRLEGEGNATP